MVAAGGTTTQMVTEFHRDTNNGATAVAAAFGGTDAVLHMIKVDNTLNTVPCYTKIRYANTYAIGTDAADIVLRTDAGKAMTHILTDGNNDGSTVDISYGTVTGAAEASTTAPTNAVTVVILRRDP